MSKVTVELTVLEARRLLDAARSIGDDIDHYGLKPSEIAAYDRAIEKLHAAIYGKGATA